LFVLFCLLDQTRRQLYKALYIIQNEKSFAGNMSGGGGGGGGGGEVDARDIGMEKANFKP